MSKHGVACGSVESSNHTLVRVRTWSRKRKTGNMKILEQLVCLALTIKLVYSNIEEYGADESDHECEYFEVLKDLMCRCSR